MANKLVEINQAHEQAESDMWSTYPQVATVDKLLAEAQTTLDELEQQARHEHKADRATATRPETAERIRAAKRRINDLRTARRAAINEVYAAGKPALVKMRQQHNEAIKACRQQYAAAGLYWATYNLVLRQHGVAVALVKRHRRAGRPARLRFHRWRGGAIAVQLQRSHGNCRCARCLERDLASWQVTAGEDGYVIERGPAATRETVACVADLPAVLDKIAAVVGVPASLLSLDHRPAPATKRAATPPPDRWRVHVTGDPAAHGLPGPVDPPRSPQLLRGGEGKWRNVLRVAPWMSPEEFDAMPRQERRAFGREGWVSFAIGGGQMLEIPVTVHRMMPPEADVLEAQLVAERQADTWRITIAITVEVPDPDPVEGRYPVALHCGWRQRPDGSVRVGTWACRQPLHPPSHLAEICVPHGDGRWGEIVVPTSWIDEAGRPPALRGRRDQQMDLVKDQLADWLDEHPQPQGEGEPDLTGAMVRQWRDPGRLTRLVDQWRSEPPAGSQELMQTLLAWRYQERHLWRWETHLRDQLTARRDNAWRWAASWLAREAGILVVDDTDYAALRRRTDITETDPVLPGVAEKQARARAVLAAPGRLRQLAVAAAERNGVTVRIVPATGLTRTCPHCGKVGDAHPRYATSAVVACPTCDRTYDQDRSAATLMLDRERSTDAPAEPDHSRTGNGS